MLSEYTKANGESLNQKIKSLIATIDGEIIEYRKYGCESISDELYSDRRCWGVYVKTDRGNEYMVRISWTVGAAVKPEKVGMRTIYLTDMEHNDLATVYKPTD